MFVEWTMEQQVDAEFLNKIIFSDDQIHPQHVTFWCGFWAGGIIGPFFENEAGQAITVIGAHYRDMIIKLFPGCVISPFDVQNWPLRSCDLTPLDFFLWGFLKSKVYVNKSTTTHSLNEEIERCINKSIQPEKPWRPRTRYAVLYTVYFMNQ